MSETVVRNFARYTPAQLSHLKDSLSLALSDEMLAYCMKHYKNVEHRDPFTDELQVLSALSLELERLPDAACVNDFSTQDVYVAQTYADMVQKRKVHNPHATYPPTLKEASLLASRELSRVGRIAKPQQRLHAQYAPDVLLEDHSATLATAHAPVRLRAVSTETATPCTGDVLVLLSATTAQNGAAFSPVPIKCSLRLRQNGILCELISHFDGVAIDLRPFSDGIHAASLTVLTGDAYRGAFILCVAAKDLQALLSHMKHRGIFGFAFARLTDAPSVTVFRPSTEAYTIQTSFLRTLFRRKRHTFNLSDEGETIAAINRTPVTDATCAYLENASIQKGSEAVSLDGIGCSAASATLSSAGFQSALYTALAPALTLAALGAPIEAQSLSITFTYSSASNCLPAILGLYRVQTELALQAHECNLIFADASEAPSLSVFSLTDKHLSPSHLSSIGASVYCLEIPVDEEGRPDFAALREALRLLADLHERGLICSAHLLLNETVGEGLEKMSTLLSCRPDENGSDFTKAYPLAILIESTAIIPLPALGETVDKETERVAYIPAVLSPRDSLIRSDRPEIVLLAAAEDEDAHVLASVLSLRGARVYRFTESEEDLLPFTRALLGAHTLILCKGTSPAKDAHLAFALETLQRAGGAILALYDCDDASVLSLPDGIPSQILESLLTIS